MGVRPALIAWVFCFGVTTLVPTMAAADPPDLSFPVVLTDVSTAESKVRQHLEDIRAWHRARERVLLRNGFHGDWSHDSATPAKPIIGLGHAPAPTPIVRDTRRATVVSVLSDGGVAQSGFSMRLGMLRACVDAADGVPFGRRSYRLTVGSGGRVTAIAGGVADTVDGCLQRVLRRVMLPLALGATLEVVLELDAI